MMRIANISFLAFQKLHEEMVEGKGISNCVCYDMLALPRYKEDLQYQPMSKRDKKKPILVYSDSLRNYIDYPYLKGD